MKGRPIKNNFAITMHSRPSSFTEYDKSNFVGKRGKDLIKGVSAYCQQTSLHGWQYLDSEKGFLQKIFWFAIVLMVLSISIFFVVNHTQTYLTSTTMTYIQSTTQSLNDIQFPSLFICNVNLVTKTFLRNLGVADDVAAANLLFKEFLYGTKTKHSTEDQAILDKMLDRMKQVYNWNIHTRFFRISSQNCSDMIIRAIWKNKYAKTFFNAYKTSTDFGACCMIVPYYDLEGADVSDSVEPGEKWHSIPRGLTRNGVLHGLKVMVDVENYDYAYYPNGGKGFRVGIEDCRDKPVINQNGIYVSPGSESLIAITPTISNTSQQAMERFSPKDRNCYADDEFRFKYLKYEDGFRYSMVNCLYETAMQQIIKKCACIPTFTSFKIKGLDELDVCRGLELNCAENIMHNLGNENMELNKAMNIHNELKTCRGTCEYQAQNIISTSTNYPNYQTFRGRKDFCLVLTKVIKICKDPVKKLSLEKRYEGDMTCNQIISLAEGNKTICKTETSIPDQIILKENPFKVFEFLNRYTANNIAILKIYLKDPYYTLIMKDEQMSTISWIGNMGGLLGLFMGLSFVSLFEILYHCVGAFVKCFKAQ